MHSRKALGSQDFALASMSLYKMTARDLFIPSLHDAIEQLDALTALEDEASEVLDTFAKKTKRTILHQVCHV